MLAKKKKKQPSTWTFILIRDRRRTSIQFRIRPAVLFGALGGVVGLMLALVWIAHTYQETASSHQMARQEIREKDILIAELQRELISLSLQTETMQKRIEQLETLEVEINRLVRPTTTGDAKTQATKWVSSRSQPSERNNRMHENAASTASPTGVGGEFYGTSREELALLAQQVRRQLDILDGQIASAAERLQETHGLARAYHEKQRVTPNLWPTVSKRITSRFGYRQDPFTKRKSFHTGIDIGGNLNDPVYAAAAGRVVAAGYQRAKGNYIAIEHGNGLQTRYFHLNKILVRKGAFVEKGQRIGLLGSTGRSTGPHLHYEMIRNGLIVDPLPYLNGTAP